MDLSTLKAQIKAGQIERVNLFSGPEIYAQNVYINQIAKVKDLQVSRVDSVVDILGKLQNRSFVSKPILYVIRDDKEFQSEEKLWKDIYNLLGDNMIIFLLTNPDKRTKFYKNFKDKIVEFEYFSEDILIKYIQKEIQLSTEACKKLIEVCESDYSRILLEIDKIKLYSYTVPVLDYNAIFKDLLKDGTIYQPPKDAIFDWVDAVLKRKVTKTFDLTEQCYASGEATMVMLSVLYNNAKQVLQVQTYRGDNISKSTGLTPWQVKCAKEKTGYYTTPELLNIMKVTRDCEKGIKTGEIEDSMAIPYILVQIL